MGEWHPYGNPNAKGEPGHKSMQRAAALREGLQTHPAVANPYADIPAAIEKPRGGFESRSIEGRKHAERLVDFIKKNLSEGRMVQVATGMRATRLKKEHMDMVKVSGDHAMLKRGNKWDIIDHTNVTAHD